MRPGRLGRWCARLIVVSALGAATFTFTAGPAGAADTAAGTAVHSVVHDGSGLVRTTSTIEVSAGDILKKADVDWQV